MIGVFAGFAGFLAVPYVLREFKYGSRLIFCYCAAT